MSAERKEEDSGAIRAEVLTVINKAFEAMHEKLDAEKQSLIEQVESLLYPVRLTEVNIPASVMEGAIFEIRAKLQKPSQRKPLDVSDQAMRIVGEIHALNRLAHEQGTSESRMVGASNRREYAMLAVLSEAMLAGNNALGPEQIATLTGYSDKGMINTIRRINTLLSYTHAKYRIVGNPSQGWILARQP